MQEVDTLFECVSDCDGFIECEEDTLKILRVQLRGLQHIARQHPSGQHSDILPIRIEIAEKERVIALVKEIRVQLGVSGSE
jgi:hypothetical protein